MYGNESAAQSRIYTYGAKPPHLNADLADNQIMLARRYRRALIEVELQRRREVDTTLREMFPRLAEIETEIEAAETRLGELREDVKRRNAAARRKVATPEDKAAIADARTRLKELRTERTEARKEAFGGDAWKERQAAINAESYAFAKRVYAHFGAAGLYWGSMLPIMQAASSYRTGAPPQLRSRDDDRGDRIAVQCAKGLSVEDALACRGTTFQLDPPPEGGRWTTARLRIGSEGRSPIWCEARVSLDRPMPEGAKIKWAYLARRRIGSRIEWQLQLVLSSDDPGAFGPHDRASSGTVAIDANWRLVEGGLRVAYWVGDDGDEGELVLPRDQVDRWGYCERLQAISDRHFDGMRETLARWIGGDPKPPEWLSDHVDFLLANLHRAKPKERPIREREIAAFATLIDSWGDARENPDWLNAVAKSLRQWRSHDRLATLCVDWRDRRFPGDDAMLDVLEEWRKRDRHLHDWSASQRVKLVRWRDENVYRNFSAMLRRKYKLAVIEDANWRDAAALPLPEEKETDAERASRVYRRVASVGRLLQTVREHMGETLRVKSADTTQRCADCGHVGGIEAAHLVVCCPECGRIEDQDRRACRNMLEAVRGPVPEKTP